MPDENDVAYPCSGYRHLKAAWELPEHLLGGTTAMRRAREKYLPMETKERHEAYNTRLERSFLYPAYEDTLDKTVAKPFAKAVSVQSVPDEMAAIADSPDGETDLTSFAKAVFRDLVHFGKFHIFVDYPDIRKYESEGPVTLATEKKYGIRPVFVRVSPMDLIGWRYEDGELVQVRIKETRVEPKGLYGDQKVEYVRVYAKTESGVVWALHRKDPDSDTYSLTDSGTMTVTRIPLVTRYADPSDGDMMCTPPFAKLAELNLAHWQSDSDQRNILRVARFAVLFFKGLTPEEAEKSITIGPFNSFTSRSAEADGKYIEHTGAAIQAGERDIAVLERRMEVMGLQPLIERSNNSTATGKRIDESRGSALIQEWIRTLEDGLYSAFLWAREWMRLPPEMPDDFSIDVYSDFAILTNREGDLTFLLNALIAQKITLETFWMEVKRRGVMSETFDPQEEAQRVGDSTDLGLITGMTDDEQE